jgi:hypothetical protein
MIIESKDFLRAKELEQEQEVWLRDRAREKWDGHELQASVKVFLYSLTNPNFYNLSLKKTEIEHITDELYEFAAYLEFLEE